MVGTYGNVIVDGCHHVSAFSFEQVLKQVKARHVLGLTATPIRKDGHHPIMMMQCGPLRVRIDPKHESLVLLRGTIQQYAGRLHRSYEGKRLVELYN
jgi:superfamily II DNA or RNA helicase